MAFRKRNIGVSRSPTSPDAEDQVQPHTAPAPIPGVRPSPIDGRPTTSTGTPSLDGILAGHAGLVLGSSLLIEESGTTEYAGALLRYCAAEGIVQGHKVHVVGVGEQWGRELPGLVGAAGEERDGKEKRERDREKMKIAWRYERLGDFGAVAERRAQSVQADRSGPPTDTATATEIPAFCHTFDLAKRLTFPTGTTINFIPLLTDPRSSPFTPILQNLSSQLSSSSPITIHRLVIPTLLSPALYPPHASQPHHLLQFLHSLRALLRQHPNRLTALITLPLELYPRTSGLVRWVELLSDGVLELTPFPHIMDIASSGAATANEEQPQGMLKVHRLPVFHEKGGGGGGLGGLGDDLAFTVSRRKFVIKPFSLPPVEGDTGAQQGHAEGGGLAKEDIEF
ncbi:Elongator subunit elp4 [Coniosporium apollinis]|uniref:Elongator complex protein 4 n=1 Tax=Coniosporium apollinis TaxID=61459 RepID=A0ABQ9P5B1_9PEZI|nr:Elongator subunit elp4 [Coniosporium apollinis]